MPQHAGEDAGIAPGFVCGSVAFLRPLTPRACVWVVHRRVRLADSPGFDAGLGGLGIAGEADFDAVFGSRPWRAMLDDGALKVIGDFSSMGQAVDGLASLRTGCLVWDVDACGFREHVFDDIEFRQASTWSIVPLIRVPAGVRSRAG